MDTPRQDAVRALEVLTAAVNDFVSNSPIEGDRMADALQRRKVLDAANAVMNAVKGPDDEWMAMLVQVSSYGAARLFYEWEAFELMPTDSSVSYDELATATKTEEALLRRVGGVLVSTGLLDQTGPDKVAHTRRSLAYRRENMASYVLNMEWLNGFIPAARYPEYFEKYGRKEPQTVENIPITYAHGHPEMGFYEMISHSPAGLNDFLKGMAHIEARMPISGIYDFSWLESEVEKHPGSDRPVFVDVGGGKGQAIKAIHTEFPGLPLSRCVLQDRPEVIAAGKALNEPELASIKRMGIDFHKEQPVKGAYAYWIRRCFHNYGDDICANMIRIIADAMADDSKVLIQEDVLDNPPSPMASALDFMMLGFGGKQRTLECWERVLGAAGLQISAVSKGMGPWKTLSVIEAVKK